MNFELTGKLIEKYDTVQISDTFRKREFVVEHTENTGGTEYIDQIKFQLTQDRCSLIDTINIHDEIRVFFNIRGRRWVKDDRVSYFTNLEAWKIEKTALSSEEPPPPPPVMDEDTPPLEEFDDLPF
ncbi:MAG: hypothetical protein AMS27_14005 [Bacteroides sp. SM23_62_1]|nr:MAG: hypothetical protein AMS27_14005 [Bacteroides sp. SM23_62_1]